MAHPRYLLSCDRRLLNAQFVVTKTQIGIQETGRNRGEVAKYTRSTGIPDGSPYCASGIYWTFDTATKVLNLERSNIPIPRTGLANGMFAYARRNGRNIGGSPRQQDLLVWRLRSTVFGHIGQVVLPHGSGWLKTIEYNTGAQNARDGDGVYYKMRNTKHPLGRMKFRGFITFRR